MMPGAARKRGKELARRNRGLEQTRRYWREFARDVLVAQKKYTENQWRRCFDRFSEDFHRYKHVLELVCADPDLAVELDPRELLVWAWCVLIAAPERHEQFYMQIPETGVGSFESMSVRLLERDFAIGGLPSAQQNRIYWLGALVRVIDAILAGEYGLALGTTQWSSEQWKPDAYPCYVIPLERQFRAEDGKNRARRGTVYHAIVPAALGSLSVELALIPDSGVAEPGASWRYGAAIFKDLTVDVAGRENGRFLVTGAPAPAAEDEIAGHIDSALAGNCDVLVWPELALPSERMAYLRQMLASDPLVEPRRVTISVAGSRHAEIGGDQWVNRTDLFAGKGQWLASYDKRRTFATRDGQFEDIVPGEKLLVIVAEDRLISVAICKDYCDHNDNEIYSRLGVDVVLVPSMGDVRTFEAHRESARRTQTNQGCVTFVVQQSFVPTGNARPAKEPPGYSMVSPDEKDADPPSRSQQTSFRVLRGRR